MLDISRARPVFYDPVLFEPNRKWAVFEDGRMCSILTTTGLTFGWGRCIGIAGVATHPEKQGRGFAQRLMETVLDVAAKDGEGRAMLFAHQQTLYKRLGFVLNDDVIRAKIQARGAPKECDQLAIDVIHEQYKKWSDLDENRLVRTPDRWRYWGLSCRACEPFLGGYACLELGMIREAVTWETDSKWPVHMSTEWYGLRSVARDCGVPIKRPSVELLFMTRGITGQPQMFMTDQF